MATGFPTKANWSAGDLLTASQMDDLAGTVNVLQNSNYPVAAGKNALINGNFDIWQRGTSSSATSGYLTADRWYCYSGGAITWSQETTTVPSGSRYCMKMLTAASVQPILYQAIETANAIIYAGQSVTLSTQIQASVSTGYTLDIQYSTSVDVGIAGSWTTITATSGGTGTAVSGSFTTVSGVYAIPSTAKSLMVRVYPTLPVASGVSLYVGKIQMELGTVVTNFARNGGTLQGEVAACRYYYRRTTGDATALYQQMTGTGYAADTANVTCPVIFDTPMRATPSSVEYSTLRLSDGTNAPTVINITITSVLSNKFAIALNVSTSAATQFRPYALQGNNSASAYLGWSAEL